MDGEEPRGQGGGEEAGIVDQLPPLPEHWRGALMVEEALWVMLCVKGDWRKRVGLDSMIYWLLDFILFPRMIRSGIEC